MKRGVVAILAVAIIGALGAYTHAKGASDSAQSSSTQPTPTETTATNPTNSTSTPQTNSSASFKDGTYTGNSEDTPYGTVQIGVTVSGGKITDVNFVQMPNDRGHTQEVTAFAEPRLKASTLNKQSANIDFVTGATTTSEAYERSMQSALDQASA